MPVVLEGKSSGKNVTSNRMTDAPTLPQVSSAGQRLFHLGTKEYGITALCEDIISYSDVTYISLSVRNGSSVSYDIKDATFVIEKTIFPEGRHGSLNCPAGDNTKIAYSFKKMTLSRDQVLRVYFYENNGQRNLQLTIDTNDINKAAGSL